MPLVLNATPGAPDANSYASLAEANGYHETRGHNDEWTAATPEKREQALVWATRLLDQEDLCGAKTFPRGALRGPRTGLVDRDHDFYPSHEIPAFWKNGVAEWALYLLREDRTADAGGLVEYGGKVGPINDPERIERHSMPASVKDMLRPLLTDAGRNSTVARVVRS